MARTESTMLDLGTKAPDFDLPDAVSGERVSLSSVADAPGLVVMFICNHCPFVKHLREGLAAFGREYAEKGVAVIAINSNDIATHPADSPDKMKQEAERFGYTFPYLFDESQEVAKAYMAACTPDFFVFDRERALVYRGQFDDARPSRDVPVTGADLRAACDAVLAGDMPSADQKVSVGCGIKWKPGNAPDYVG